MLQMRALDHGAKLEHRKAATAISDPGLREKRRAGRSNHNCQDRNDQNRRESDEPNAGKQDIDSSLGKAMKCFAVALRPSDVFDDNNRNRSG